MEPQVAVAPSAAEVPAVVLDTNVVLGLHWFEDPSLRALGSALQAGVLRWYATSQMRDELVHVMAHGTLATAGPGAPPSADSFRARCVIAAFDQQALLVPAPTAVRVPRCTDAQDQMFIDLALDVGARWLFSRDKAVLKLNRKAFALTGCQIIRPQDWRT